MWSPATLDIDNLPTTDEDDDEEEQEDDETKAQVEELSRALAATAETDKRLTLPRGCQLDKAENAFAQNKFGIAHTNYASLNVTFHAYMFDPRIPVQPHQVFLQTRAVLCQLGQKKYESSVEFLEARITDDLIGSREVAEALTVWLFANKEYKICTLIALKATTKYPDHRVFGDAISSCLMAEPELATSISATPWSFFQDCKLRPNVFNKHNNDYGYGGAAVAMPPSLRESDRRRRPIPVPLAIRRILHCHRVNKDGLAGAILKSLSLRQDLSVKDRVMFEYCRISVLSNGFAGDNPKGTLAAMVNLRSKHAYFEIFYGLAQVQIKLQMFEEAETTIKAGLELNSKSQCATFDWPQELQQLFHFESNVDLLENMLRRQLSLVSTTKIPDATCRAEGCLVVARGGVREIYSEEATTTGYYVIKCTEKCSVEFHQSCWKKAKESRKEKRECFTPDCRGLLSEIQFVKDGKAGRVKDPVLNWKPIPPLVAPTAAVAPSAAKPRREGRKEGDHKGAAAEHGVREHTAKGPTTEQHAKPVERAKESVPDSRTGGILKSHSKDDFTPLPPPHKVVHRTSSNDSHGREAVTAVPKADVGGGAIPKATKAKRSGGSGNKFSQKLTKLGQMREHYQKNLLKLSKDEFGGGGGNQQNAFFNLVRKSGNIITIDDGNYTSSVAPQEARRAVDEIREQMVEYRQQQQQQETKKRVEPKAEDESELVSLRQQLHMEKELTFYLYQCLRKAIAEKEEVRMPDSTAEPFYPSYFPTQNRLQTTESHLPEMMTQEEMISLYWNGEEESQNQLSQDDLSAATTIVSTASSNIIDPDVIEIIMTSYPYMTELEVTDLVRKMAQEEAEDEYEKLDEAAATVVEQLDEDALEALIELKRKGLLNCTISPPAVSDNSPSFEYVDVDDDYDNPKECVVCLEDITSADEFVLPHCRHSFHRECITKWLREKSDCPSCRNHIVLEEEYPALAISAAGGKMRR